MRIRHWRFLRMILTALTLRFTRVDWLVPAASIAFGVVRVVAGTVRLSELAGGAVITPENTLI